LRGGDGIHDGRGVGAVAQAQGIADLAQQKLMIGRAIGVVGIDAAADRIDVERAVAGADWLLQPDDRVLTQRRAVAQLRGAERPGLAGVQGSVADPDSRCLCWVGIVRNLD